MTDTLDPPVPPVPGSPPATGGGDRIEPVDIQQEMQRSYIEYRTRRWTGLRPSSTSGSARPTMTLIA